VLHRINTEPPAGSVAAASTVVWSVEEYSSVRSVATTSLPKIKRSRRQRLSGSPEYVTMRIVGGRLSSLQIIQVEGIYTWRSGR
jgi:hypothetical protein